VRFLAEPAVDAGTTLLAAQLFLREMIPLLTPIGLDPSHPFRACSTRA